MYKWTRVENIDTGERGFITDCTFGFFLVETQAIGTRFWKFEEIRVLKEDELIFVPRAYRGSRKR